jgi:hypothetical protein
MELVVDGDLDTPAIIGKAAHIAGEKPTAARYDPAMTEKQRNDVDNLIYICGKHHDQVVIQREDFPVELLRKWKQEHEKRVREAIADGFSEVGFAELEVATNGIAQTQPGEVAGGFVVVPPEEKIKKNRLTVRSRHIIVQGLAVAREVREFIESVSQTDNAFPERLKAGFLSEYYRLVQEGHKGDDLFELMCSFAQRGFRDVPERSAGLAVLVYLFEACEVFEK